MHVFNSYSSCCTLREIPVSVPLELHAHKFHLVFRPSRQHEKFGFGKYLHRTTPVDFSASGKLGGVNFMIMLPLQHKRYKSSSRIATNKQRSVSKDGRLDQTLLL